MRNSSLRAARALTVIGLAAAACSVPLTAAVAAPAAFVDCDYKDPGTCSKYVQFEVVNNSGSKADLHFYTNDSKDRGWTTGAGRAGLPALPAKTTIDSNARSEYSSILRGQRIVVKAAPSSYYYYSFDNYFNIRAMPTDSQGNVTLGTFKDKASSKTISDVTGSSGTLTPNGKSRLQLSMQALPPSSGDFAKKYRLTITDSMPGRPDGNATMGSEFHAGGAPVPGSTYTIGSANLPDYVVDVPGSSTDWGKQLQLYKSNDTGAQQWTIVDTKAGDGYYQIRNAKNGLCIDLSGADPAPGAPVQQYKCDPNGVNQPNQLWKFEQVAGGTSYKIVSKTGLTLARKSSGDPILLNGAKDPAGELSTWKVSNAVLDSNGQFQQEIKSLTPNTDYAVSQCKPVDGTPPSQVSINGRTYDFNTQIKDKQIWVTSGSQGDIVFASSSKFRPLDCKFQPVVTAPKITRLTGEWVGRPVYRIDIPEQTRAFQDGLPSDIPIAPYSVEGLQESGEWKPVGSGKVLPMSQPKIDQDAKRVTFGAASFFFENEPGKPAVSKLRVSGAYQGWKEIDLASAPEPAPEDLLGYSLEVQPATGTAVTANGLSQETLRLVVKDGKRAVNPADPMGRIYDYVYFRKNGKLLTGMVEDGGYTVVSPVQGSYLNKLSGVQAAAGNPTVYLSTTAESTQSGITGHLDINEFEVKLTATVPDIKFASPSTTYDHSTNASITPLYPAADPNSGALYFRNVGKEQMTAGILTRYEAVTSGSNLPRATPYWGYYDLYSDGTALRLNSTQGLQDTTNVDSGFIMNNGTYVPVANMPK